jgi:hypothetical protein
MRLSVRRPNFHNFIRTPSSVSALELWAMKNLVDGKAYKIHDISDKRDKFVRAAGRFAGDRNCLLRIARTALARTKGFFAAQFSSRWSDLADFDAKRPLEIHEPCNPLTALLHLAHKGELPEITRPLLSDIVIPADKFCCNKSIAAWAEEVLEATRCPHFLHCRDWMWKDGSSSRADWTPKACPRYRISPLDALLVAFILKLPASFAAASRELLWTTSLPKLRACARKETVALLPSSFVKNSRAGGRDRSEIC